MSADASCVQSTLIESAFLSPRASSLLADLDDDRFAAIVKFSPFSEDVEDEDTGGEDALTCNGPVETNIVEVSTGVAATRVVNRSCIGETTG